jgi:hypothetical protein
MFASWLCHSGFMVVDAEQRLHEVAHLKQEKNSPLVSTCRSSR